MTVEAVEAERSPSVSVVIPCRDREGLLAEQLGALASQSFGGSWEIVVADNDSDPAALEAALAMRPDLPPLRVVDARGARNAAAVRNVGAATAGGELLLFTDADDIVAPGWLASLSAALEHHPFVTGPVRYVDFEFRAPPFPGDFRQPSPPRHLGVIPFAHASNLGVRRAVFESIGGFDPAFDYAEDIDFAVRLAYAGVPLHWEPEARLLVRRRSGLRSAARQHYRFGKGDALLLRRHGRRGLPRGTVWGAVRSYGAALGTVYRVLTPRRRLSWVQNSAACTGRAMGYVFPRRRQG